MRRPQPSGARIDGIGRAAWRTGMPFTWTIAARAAGCPASYDRLANALKQSVRPSGAVHVEPR
jgi:hypothetical protein